MDCSDYRERKPNVPPLRHPFCQVVDLCSICLLFSIRFVVLVMMMPAKYPFDVINLLDVSYDSVVVVAAVALSLIHI